MKSALLLNASPMGEKARAYDIALTAAEYLRRAYPGLRVIRRDLSQGGFGWASLDYAHAIVSRTGHDAPVFRDSEKLILELEQTEALIISTPMHNYTVPAVLKLWIDLVLRAGRSFGFRDGRKVGLLADRPTLIVVASGGAVTTGASQPDHLTGYLTDVLATIGIHDLRFVHVEGLARPDMAEDALNRGHGILSADPQFGSGSFQRAKAG